MTPDQHRADVSDMQVALRRQQLLSMALGTISAVLAVAVLAKRTTVILEPPSRSQTIAVTGDRVDGAWLQEMAIYLAHLMLDATPHSIGWQHDQVLKWVHPSMHGELQQRMAVQAKRLTEANATTVFWPQQVAPDVDRQQVVVLGHLDTYINGQSVAGSGRSVAYLASFETRGGRMLLKDWAEVPKDDPWLVKALDDQDRARGEAEPNKGASRGKN